MNVEVMREKLQTAITCVEKDIFELQALVDSRPKGEFVYRRELDIYEKWKKCLADVLEEQE